MGRVVNGTSPGRPNWGGEKFNNKQNMWKTILVLLIACGMLQSVPSTATVSVFTASNIGDKIIAKIRLVQQGSWPSGKEQTASGIPVGYYEIEVVAPGFRSYRRALEVGEGHTEVRVVLLVSDELGGEMSLAGKITDSKNPSGLWVVAFPLAASPDDVLEAR